MNIKGTTKEIYLQNAEFDPLEVDITWCSERINDEDVKYVRYDLYDTALERIGEVNKIRKDLEAENERLREGHIRSHEESDYCYVCDCHQHAKDCPVLKDK